MSTLVFFKLLAIFVIVAIGWIVGRLKWLGDERHDPARTLANAAYYIFVPALLFRTTARIDFATMPWGTLVAVFAPLQLMLLLVYGWHKLALRRASAPAPAGEAAVPARTDETAVPARTDETAVPAVRAISASFGNTVQVGIPMAAALFGESGLQIHLAIVSLHALALLTLTTALVELDLARVRHTLGTGELHLGRTLWATARHTIVHPVVLPVLVGLGWNVLGLPVPTVADEILATLGQAVVPLCLVLIGMSLAYYGTQGARRHALVSSALKLLVLPALVLAIAHWAFHLSGVALAVVVMMAALPIGSNALIFAQRYRTIEAETTAATVFSTLAFVVTAPLWLAVLKLLA